MTRFKTLITALVLILSLGTGVARAQFPLQTIGSVLPRETSGSITTDGQCVTLALWGFSGLGVQVSGTWTGTLQFQVSADGTNYQTVTMFPTNSTTGVTSTTANGQWGSAANSSHLRVCATAAMTGTAVVSLSGRMPGTAGGGGGGGAVTQFAEDTAHTTGDTGIQVLAVRNDAGAALATTTGDYIPLTTDSTGALRISGGAAGGTSSNFGAAFPTAGTAIGFTDGTNMVAGRAVDADTSGGTFNVAAFNLVFRTAGTPVEAGTSSNPFNVVFPSAQAVTQSGTWNINNVSGTVSLPTGAATAANQSTQITALQLIDDLVLAEDGVHASGEVGVLGLAVRNDAGSLLAADGDRIPFSVDSAGRLRIAPPTADSNFLSTIDGTLTDILNAMSTDAVHDVASINTGPQIMGHASTTVPTAVTAGDAVKAWYTLNGAQVVRQTDGTNLSALDPCQTETKVTTPISLTADTVIITATASKKNYICSISVIAAAAEVFNIVEGTGSTCGTSTAALVGSTTDANGMSFAANGGYSAVGGNAAVIVGITANVDTCIRISTTNRISGYVTWVQR